eukprot:9174808-Pyramimonas_sp.AAC.1
MRTGRAENKHGRLEHCRVRDRVDPGRIGTSGAEPTQVQSNICQASPIHFNVRVQMGSAVADIIRIERATVSVHDWPPHRNIILHVSMFARLVSHSPRHVGPNVNTRQY